MLDSTFVPAPLGRPPSVLVSPGSHEAFGIDIARFITVNSFGSAVWPTANMMIAYPFSFSRFCTAVKLWVFNGTVVSGNVDIGIYDDAGNRLVSAGSTAHATTSNLQKFDTTDLGLAAGKTYYMAMALDNVTGTVQRHTAPTTADQIAGLGVVQAASSFPLPATVTFAKLTQNYLPWFGLSRLVTF